jgi:DNA-binding NarL/FixJ family response regulator
MSSNEECIRVAVIAPQMTCWGLQQMVQSSRQLEWAGSACALSSASLQLIKVLADVVVADVDHREDLPHLSTFMSFTSARVVVLTGMTDLSPLDQAVLQGVKGVVRKSEPPSVLLKAIEKVHGGELWIDRSATGRIFMEMIRQKAAQRDDPELAKIATLTHRERQAIAAIASDTGAPGKVIAGRLCISEHTLRNHLSSIYSKLDLSNRLDLYAFATRHQLDKPAA